MSIVTLRTNHVLTTEIFKRTVNQLYIDPLRKGFVYSWLPNEKTFRAYFQDNQEEASFSSETNLNYIDPTRYNSALSYNGIFSEIAKRIAKSELSQQPGEYEITLHNISIQKFWYAEHFQAQFSEYNLEFMDKGGNNFTLRVNTKENLLKTISFLQLLTFLFAINQKEPIELNENNVDKYISIAEAFSFSYFIIYLLKINLLNNKKLFDMYKKRIENISNNHITLTFGDNHSQRRFVIESQFEFAYPIINIESGEGYLALYINRNHPTLQYYAIDTDFEVRNILKRKIWLDRLLV